MKKVNSPWKRVDPAAYDLHRKAVFVRKYLTLVNIEKLYGLGHSAVWALAHGQRRPTVRTAQIIEAAFNDLMRLAYNARRIKAGIGSVRRVNFERLPW
jgi:hypothetical protein